jgi:hypothetical protein
LSPATGSDPCGFPLGKVAGNASRLPMGRWPHPSLPPSQVMRRHAAFLGDVPLPANGSHSLIGLKGRHLPAATDGAPGVLPFAVLLLLTGGSARFRAAGPTCRLPERPPRSVLDRGIGRHLPKFRRADICPTRVETVDPRRSGRLLGFGPVSNPCPPFPGRADTALGFRPLSGIWLIVSQQPGWRTLESSDTPSAPGAFFRLLSADLGLGNLDMVGSDC